ncbi:MAG: hypothetical protein FWC92_02715 [Defluviitaleaceae bacterium]|nr:hypothetical protein [Defluviitaleaceae bacterium]
MENNLKNRYIYAVTRHLPTKIAADVEMELDSLITEMLNERNINSAPGPLSQYPPNTPNREYGNQPISEQDIHDVLAELGPPEELALKYYGSERKSLISGVYFLMYKRVLRIALPIIAAVLTVLTTIGLLVGDEYSLHIVIGFANVTFAAHAIQVVVVTVGGVLQAFAVITVVFAILDYMKVDLKDDEIYNLPQVPEARLKMSPYGPIFDIILSVSLTALLLGFPQVMRVYLDFNWIPVFDTAALRSMWLPILLWTVLEIGVEIFKLVEGQYTTRLGTVTIISCVVQVIFAITIFGNVEILNPEFVGHAYRLMDTQAFYWLSNFNNIVTRPNLALLVIVLFALLIETIDVVAKSFSLRRVSSMY